jgi:hypothetical protein
VKGLRSPNERERGKGNVINTPCRKRKMNFLSEENFIEKIFT